MNFDTGALLRGRAIDARRIGLHRPRENSLQWGARIARHRDRRGCTAMHPNSVAPNWDALQGIGMHCDTAPFKLAQAQVLDGVGLCPEQVQSHDHLFFPFTDSTLDFVLQGACVYFDRHPLSRSPIHPFRLIPPPLAPSQVYAASFSARNVNLNRLKATSRGLNSGKYLSI